MKHIFNKGLLLLASVIVLAACEKNAVEDQYEPVANGAMIKFIHASQEAPMANFFINDQRLTALAPTTSGRVLGISYGGTPVYPATFGYLNVPAGSYTITAKDTATIRGTITPAGETITSLESSLEENKNYSVFLVGKTGAFQPLVIQDELPPSDYTKAYVRFVNAMVDAPTNFDIKALKSGSTTPVDIASNIAFKGNSNYVELEPGTYNFPIYRTGSTTPYTTITGAVLGAGTVRTIYTRGNYAATAAIGNRSLVRDR